MLDVGKALRKAYFDLLDGNITYNTVTVPIYDLMTEDATEDLFVVIGNSYFDNRDTLSNFNTGAVMILQIFHRTYMASSKDAVDSVADQICQLLIPTPASNGLVIDTDFAVHNVQMESSSYVEFQPNAERVVQRVLRFRQVVQELF
jgi:hypothetical protein